MSKFKVGDSVFVTLHEKCAHLGPNRLHGVKYAGKVVKGSSGEGWIGVYTNKLVGHLHLTFNGDDCSHFTIEHQENEKESIAKWLKGNKWFIRTGSLEKSELVQEWLFEHGYGWGFGKNISDFKEKYLTNTSITGELCKYILHGNSDKTNAQEIKIEFETVVKSVQLPEIAPKKTEQQLRIEELEATIAQASAQIKQLKEEM